MFINAGLNKIFHYIPVPDDLPRKSGESHDGIHRDHVANAIDCDH